MIQPLLDYVVIKEIVNKLTSEESGIVLPESADVPYSIRGEVVSLGEGVTLPIAVGDSVLFKRHAFEEIEFENVKYLVGQQLGIYAKV